MTKVALALGSFALGVALGSLSFGSHTVTLLQPLFAQTALVLDDKEPTIPPLGAPMLRSSFTGATQALDGINCTGCTIEAAAMSYAGGAFKCSPCTLKPQIVQLKGAALNTVIFLRDIGAFGATPPRGKPFDPSAPHVDIASDKRNVQLELVSASQ
jgi:hypothetical protein